MHREFRPRPKPNTNPLDQDIPVKKLGRFIEYVDLADQITQSRVEEREGQELTGSSV